MGETASDSDRAQNTNDGMPSVADELQRESDRLRQLAEQVKTREEAQAEIQANYPHFQRLVYASLREMFERDVPPLPDKDLPTVAAEEGAQPLEAFITELDKWGKGRSHAGRSVPPGDMVEESSLDAGATRTEPPREAKHDSFPQRRHPLVSGRRGAGFLRPF